MRLAPGSHIGPYEIIAPIGAGGMGEVYRARDVRLGREIALKVISSAFAQDPSRLARFEREAKVLASLNHPNIAAIYGVEQGAIVMEFVDGENLNGPVPVDLALHYARQIASGLEAAHEKGIIHRDLKPANIKVLNDGTVKILDFGLAKEHLDSGSSNPEIGPTVSPTASLSMTASGVILGTAAYMSPEQARGRAVDKRADIWAFGVVLYELLTGRKLFSSEDITETIAAVMTRDPDWSFLPASTPESVRRLLEVCLRKDPKSRLRDIGDARLQLDEPPHRREHRSPILPWAVAAAMALAAVLVGARWFSAKHDADVRTVRYQFTLPEGTLDTGALNAPPAVPSPDGRFLAFTVRDAESSKQHLWVQPLDSTVAQRLDGTEDASFPFWSPDGQFIGFFADQKIKSVPVTGGSPRVICEAPRARSVTSGNGATWSRDGVILFNFDDRGPLMQVFSRGGTAKPVTTVDTSGGETLHSWPQFLPNGKHFLYFAGNEDPGRRGIYVQELGDSKRSLIVADASMGVWTSGRLLFVRQNRLFAQRFNPTSFQLTGEPALVVANVGENSRQGRCAVAASPNGILTYRGATAGGARQLAWYDRGGRRLETVGAPGEFLSVRLSPDDRSAAVTRGNIGTADTWIVDLSGGIASRLTDDAKDVETSTVWSPDSRRVAISRADGETRQVTVASGATRLLSKEGFFAQDWSPDGQLLLLSRNGRALVILPVSDDATPGTARTLLDTPSLKLHVRLSRDGRWVAFVSNETNEYAVYVASFPSFKAKRRVSPGDGFVPMWRGDGKELFYLSGDSTLMSADIRLGSSSIEIGASRPLFKTNVYGPWYGVAADGKRFLIGRPKSAERMQITVVLNWSAKLQ